MDQGNTMIFSSGDAYAVAPEKKSKIKWIALIAGGVLLLAAILVASLWLVPNATSISKERATEELTVINDDISDLEGWLGDIYDGEIAINRMPNGHIDEIIKKYEAIKTRCDEICKYSSMSFASGEQNDKFAAAIAVIKQRVDFYGPSVQMLADFNTAFIGTIEDISNVARVGVEVDTDKLLAGNENEEAKRLLGSDNEQIKTIATRLGAYIDGKMPVAKNYVSSGCRGDKQAAVCGGLRIQLLLSSASTVVGDKAVLKNILVAASGDEDGIDYDAEGYAYAYISGALALLRQEGD